MDIELFKDLHTWFMKNGACTVFKDSPISNDVQALLPTIIQDQKNNDCAEEINPSLKCTFRDTQYFFSST